MEFYKELKKIERPFKNWSIDSYKATNCNFSLWVGSGFLNFRDYSCHAPKQQLVDLLNIFQKYYLWKKLRQEIEIRAFNKLKNE